MHVIKVTLVLAAIGGCLSSISYAQIPQSPPVKQDTSAEESKTSEVDLRKELIYRANLGRAEDIKLLVSQGGSPNQQNPQGVPLLCLAAARKDGEGINVARALVELGADINGRDRKGQTALFYAARQGNTDIATFLLDQHIDAAAIDNEGNVARNVAFRSGFNDLMKKIDESMSKPGAIPAAPAASQTSAGADSTNIALLPPQLPEPAEKTEPTAKLADAIAQMKKVTPTKEDMKRVQEELAAANKKSLLEEQKNDYLGPRLNNTKSLNAIHAGPAMEEMMPGVEVLPNRRKDFEAMAHDVAYSTCAFQYWSFCNDVHQSTELESEEVTVAIMSNHAKVEVFKDKMINQYGVKPETYNAIMDSAQQRIYNQLNDMPSNQYRHERNIGKMDDMMKRCGEIGRQWAVAPPGIHAKKKVRSQNTNYSDEDTISASTDDDRIPDPEPSKAPRRGKNGSTTGNRR